MWKLLRRGHLQQIIGHGGKEKQGENYSSKQETTLKSWRNFGEDKLSSKVLKKYK
jgi:hypothetical protein